jgi:putative membrane protein
MKRPVKLLFAACLSAALVSCGNQGQQEDSKDVAEQQNESNLGDSDLKDDSEFAVEAAASSLLEIQLGQLAQTKAASPAVKKFAETMVTEHAKASDELKTLAQQKNITLPSSLTEEHQKKYEDLNEKQGAEFDREYMDLMVKAHEEDVDEFEDQAEDGNDPELKAWASEKVTHLRQHLEMAKATQDQVKN